MIRDQKVIAIVILVFFIAMAAVALTFHYPGNVAPLVVSGVMIIIAILHAFQEFKPPRIRGDENSGTRQRVSDSDHKHRHALGRLLMLIVSFYLFGQAIGLAIFAFSESYFVAKEGLAISLILSFSIAAGIYMLFTWGFDILLYDGLLLTLVA